jgi:hypothetical protein
MSFHEGDNIVVLYNLKFGLIRGMAFWCKRGITIYVYSLSEVKISLSVNEIDNVRNTDKMIYRQALLSQTIMAY